MTPPKARAGSEVADCPGVAERWRTEIRPVMDRKRRLPTSSAMLASEKNKYVDASL